ncbi:MAG: carbon-nitrogen hydrolase family protein [Chloroflexi bacterium]|nr:carbon-nitrogen hydrolase family protein [Chloroflexota bacterium]
MKEEVKVAAVQMEVKWLDLEANIARVQELTEKVVAEGPVDLIVFPETANSGLPTKRDKYYGQKLAEIAERIPGPFTKTLATLAKKHSTYIVAGLTEAHPTIPFTFYNSAALIGPEGNVMGVYHKAHIPSEEKHYFYPGSTVEVFPTELGNVAIQICADFSFPEYSRVFALKGAEIQVVTYSRGKRDSDLDLYHHVVACRAYENQNFVVSCNRVGVHAETAVGEGRSCIAAPNGVILARSDTENEEILRATLKRDVLVSARTNQSRFRDRRPDLYGIVTEGFEET